MNTISPTIVADKLAVVKQKRTILDDLSFTIQPGSITGLIGPSGSGKTTLMRTIVGVQPLSSGTLRVLDEPAGSAVLRQKIGYVTQTASIYGDLTVEQNIRYFGTIIGVKAADVPAMIATVHLTKQRAQLVDSLSGGQKARVSLAIASLGDPALLVLDEPTVGLDPILREELWELFGEIASSGKTIVISSHVMDEAQRCDQLLLLRDGKMVWNSSRAALLKQTATHDVGAAFVAMIQRGES